MKRRFRTGGVAVAKHFDIGGLEEEEDPSGVPGPVVVAAPAAPVKVATAADASTKTQTEGLKQKLDKAQKTGSPLSNIESGWKRALMGGLLGGGLGGAGGIGGMLGGGILGGALVALLGGKDKRRPMDEKPEPAAPVLKADKEDTLEVAKGGSVPRSSKRRLRFQEGGGVPESAGQRAAMASGSPSAGLGAEFAKRTAGMPTLTGDDALQAAIAKSGMSPGDFNQHIQQQGGVPIPGLPPGGPPPGGPPPGMGGPPPGAGMGIGVGGPPPPGPPPGGSSLGALPPGPMPPPGGPPPGGSSLGAMPPGPMPPPGGPPPVGVPPVGAIAGLDLPPGPPPGPAAPLPQVAAPGAAMGAGLPTAAPGPQRPRRPVRPGMKKGGAVKGKGRGVLTRRPKISLAIAKKKSPVPTPAPYEIDAPDAPPPTPLAKGGKCIDKMAAGGAAKARKGYPKITPKRMAHGGKVRGCGAATKGTTFSGIF